MTHPQHRKPAGSRVIIGKLSLVSLQLSHGQVSLHIMLKHDLKTRWISSSDFSLPFDRPCPEDIL